MDSSLREPDVGLDGLGKTIETLNDAARQLETDVSIDELEHIESELKLSLRGPLSSDASPANPLGLAASIRELGFFRKYKSYAVKAATPMGYSIFFQQHGRGFSFQQHRGSKYEIFHILETDAASLVFLATYQEWLAAYDTESFEAWLQGGPDDNYDRYTFRPEPGDLFLVDRPDTVHTVLGCLLEEFATHSTDLVDRLYDQNIGRATPAVYERQRVERWLADLPDIMPRRLVRYDQGTWSTEPAVATRNDGVSQVLLKVGDMEARFVRIEDGRSYAETKPAPMPATIVLRSGRAVLHMAQDRLPPGDGLSLKAGEYSIVPKGFRWVLEAGSDAVVSIHSVPADVGLAI